MAKKYRVIHQRKTMWEAMFAGRTYRDWYLAQTTRWWGWRTLSVFPTIEEAERCCADHAGGTLVKGGGRIISEFERPDD